MSWNKRRVIGYIIVLGIFGMAAAAFLMLGPPKLLAKSETPDFCSSCHVMEAEYEAWFHEGAHRRINCVDCHLPHDNIALHYTWKSIDGMKDVMVFYSGRVPEKIAISRHGQDVVQANCIRCHETFVEKIDTERQCWNCHRRLAHVRSGIVETR
ncbi:MAG: cytochrome c nitrite reductase small subunit [Syntrophobacteraceae bacterium]